MNTSTHTVSRTQAWLESLRPRTLPLAFSAILVGSALAGWQGYFDPVITLLALLTAKFSLILPTIMATPSKAVTNRTASARCAACKKGRSPRRR